MAKKLSKNPRTHEPEKKKVLVRLRSKSESSMVLLLKLIYKS